MSTPISLVALCLATYTWWQTPPEVTPTIIEVPVPASDSAAEFSCSARCPAPVQQIVPHVAESSPFASALFWTFFGAALCAVFFLLLPKRGARRSTEPVQYLPVLAAGEIEEVEPVVTRGVTPQRLRLRRQRALIDGA